MDLDASPPGLHDVASYHNMATTFVPENTRFRIDINARFILDRTPNNTSDRNRAFTGTMAHELGHVVGLADNPVGTTTFSCSVMRYFEVDSSCTGQHMIGNNLHRLRQSPSTFDIASVNMLHDR